jgi:hypothetical protein
MGASEDPTVAAAERERIVYELAVLHALVTATPQDTPLDFWAVPGRSGGYPPGPPQTRTSAIDASGSSEIRVSARL